ncbi:MAG: TerB family tellurite resistance protein [Archangium sp.]
MTLTDDDRFNLEVLKLLLNVAWADGEVAAPELNMVLGLGRSWSVPEPEIQKLIESTKTGQRPVDPEFSLLRTRADEALEAARALVLADGKVMPEESALLKKVQAALATP